MPGERVGGRDLWGVWDQHVHTAIFEMDKTSLHPYESRIENPTKIQENFSEFIMFSLENFIETRERKGNKISSKR